MAKGGEARRVATGLAFIAPNILGFLAFTLFPLVFSLIMAFTNWDIRLHNIFKDESVRFVGFENFTRLLNEPDFFKYLGNTFFLMIGIPFGVAGSLIAAILLSQQVRGSSRKVWGLLLAGVGLTLGTGALVLAGCGATAMVVLVTGVAGVVLLAGSLGGRVVYRTLFYCPHFTAGVATFLLWKKLYSPYTGPVNNALRDPLAWLASTVEGMPADGIRGVGWICAALACLLALWGARILRRGWRDGETGVVSAILGAVLLGLPAIYAPRWALSGGVSTPILIACILAVLWIIFSLIGKRDFSCGPDRGIGHAVITCGGIMTAQFALVGVANVFHILPDMSTAGIDPPEWLTQYHWAKPSLIIMGLWAAIGSNSMLLYLAGLSNIPTELYEAADIDGASPLQRFWNVTWPQLAPVTFFIVIMAVIGGLQGGFEMARTMTKGGPAGSTTTLAYYVYTEGFETGRLGYASAVAWALFVLVFSVTMFNWKFGNRYVNE